jgi:MFS family permease
MVNAPVAKGRRRLPALVFTLGWVSFCNDAASEMILPLLPAFLLGMGGTRFDLGLLQGLSELLLSALKIASGWLSDHQHRKKPWLIAGYGLSCAVRPLLCLVLLPWQAILVRSCDRVGKGLRSAPRDALLVDVVAPTDRGAAFGMQRAMDHGGALTGALLAAVLLWVGFEERAIFALAVVPGFLVMLLLRQRVHEPEAKRRQVAGKPVVGERAQVARLMPFFLVVLLGAFGSGIDLFLLVRALSLGMPRQALPLLWALLHLVRAGLAAPMGALSDSLSRRRVIACGLGIQAFVMLGFGLVEDAIYLWPLFALHGLHAAFTEGAERGYIADLTGAGRRGTVFGVYYAVQGVAALAAPLCLSAIWDAHGPLLSFGSSAVLQVLAMVLLLLLVPSSRARSDLA